MIHDHPTERDLTGLADGSLPAARRARVERAVAASPELQTDLAAQRRALTAVRHAAGQPAPAALRARLALAGAPAHQPAGAHRRTAPRTARAFTGAADALAAAVLVVLLIARQSTTGAPSVALAATLAAQPPTAPAPGSSGENRVLIGLRAAGLPYPYWEDRFHYRATGVRRDRLAGRLATTVYYTRAGHQLAYTILTGTAIPAGVATHNTVTNGISLRSFTAHGRLIVTWLRRGHTCILTATNTQLPVLLRLASWKGDGKIPY